MSGHNLHPGKGSRGQFWFELPVGRSKKGLLLKALIILLVAAGIGLAIVRLTSVVSQPHNLARYEAIPWVKYVHPNVAKLHAAQRLVEEGKRAEARHILVDALLTAPHSPVTREMRDSLGDINTELFFSRKASPRKVEYTIRPGDALSAIARRLQSSTEAIMQINQLESASIRVGDKLVVPKLDFTITIDLPRERVVLHDSRGFFTQYPIASADVPPARVVQMETKVRAKSFWQDGRPVSPGPNAAREGTPRIYLRKHGYVLYGVDEASETTNSKIDIETDRDDSRSAQSDESTRPPQGVAMWKKDIAQLESLIRAGTPVTIILDQRR